MLRNVLVSLCSFEQVMGGEVVGGLTMEQGGRGRGSGRRELLESS
jgi:hypothetical protein